MNYYTLLGTHAGATMEVLRNSYRKVAWSSHPDRILGGAATPEENARFVDISAAYHVLKDRYKRAAYDEQQALRHAPCPYCSKGAVYLQKGFNRREVRICPLCDGSGLQEKSK